MILLHGTWVPNFCEEFENRGEFVVWIETTGDGLDEPSGIHSSHLSSSSGSSLTSLISDQAVGRLMSTAVSPQSLAFFVDLPSNGKRPLPSLEIAQLTGEFLPDRYSWQTWRIYGIHIPKPLPFLRELRFIASYRQSELRLAADLEFWLQYAQQMRNLIRQHQFLPVMKCHQSGSQKSKLTIHSGWEPVGEKYERELKEFAACMPGICRVAGATKPRGRIVDQNPIQSEIDVLRHFSEQQIDDIVSDTAFTQKIRGQMSRGWIADALDRNQHATRQGQQHSRMSGLEDWKQWQSWYMDIVGRTAEVRDSGFVFGIRLDHEVNTGDDKWRLSYFAASSLDPSLRIDLAEWWGLSQAKQKQWLKHFGPQFERQLLIDMGHAARICPLLWQGMETEHPSGIGIDLDTAYGFLKEDALLLESAGFRILLPSWWTPKGRRRARIRISASTRLGSADTAQDIGYFSLPSLVQYKYELSVGGEPVSEQEWQQLVNAKTPLVRFRGEWMELDTDQMSQMLELWRLQEQEGNSATVGQMLRQIAEMDEDSTEFVFDEVLQTTLSALQSHDGVKSLEDPAGLNGELRPYQIQGLSWLATQEALRLNPCLADDMGLGKTIQVIALLLYERENMAATKEEQLHKVSPTLLIAPTSVLSNWRKEVKKFAPQLKCYIHHGADRNRDEKAFAEVRASVDIVITSFALASKDRALLKKFEWGRIVVDEAQNIKNPKTAQARAICSFRAPLRIAMTGTPVENRLTDLWSIFNFLNPGYLGTQAQFKRAYETPVQRDSNHQLFVQLQQLVQPFILRRLKSDKSIIADLPDKLEQKVFCNLTKEQASLYQAVVDDTQKQLEEESEGIQRKGLILSTLMKLKQICNHPSQFLQDGSSFSETRSHKLMRLTEMIEEALAESDSMLVFTQFTEIGAQLETMLRNRYRCPVYYLHGGTSRKRREQMVESFQDSESSAGIFILSLRAGGVGITLTQANHVFHFDRWWNPAVENQATDRAYRIGQEKTVFAHKMVTLGTLEERIDKMIEDKQVLADSIVGSDESWLTEMDNDAFRQLIELNREAIMET